MASRVTIKSIAADLGISHMTVSRALSDNPNVTQATREAVQKRAQELGYVKNVAAKAMRGDASKIIGLLLPNITNEFYAHFANTLAQACDQQAYHLVIHLTNDQLEVEQKAISKLREVQAQAVIMVPCPEDKNLPLSSFGNLDVVQLIRQRDIQHPYRSILVDDTQAITDAVMSLANQGHQNIAYIGADESLSSGKQRLAAYQQGLRKANLTVNPSLVTTGSPSFETGSESALSAIGNGATAIVCGGFELSNGALSAYMADNDSTSNLAFVGYGNPSFYNWIRGGISTIDIPVEQLAFDALNLITDDHKTTNIAHSASLLIRP